MLRGSELISNKPMTQAEKEALDLKKAKIEFEKEKENKLKIEKSKKNEIARKTIIRKVEELKKIVSKVESPSDLSDQEIRAHMLDTKKWEDKLDQERDSNDTYVKELGEKYEGWLFTGPGQSLAFVFTG